MKIFFGNKEERKRGILENLLGPGVNQFIKSLSLEFDVYFIDTNKHLNEYSKENLFCDIMHKTRKGNRVTAQIIHKFIKINNND